MGAGLAARGAMGTSPDLHDLDADHDRLVGATDGPVARRPRTLRRSLAVGFVRGFAGGVVATLAMSGVMLAAQKGGLLGQMPPKKIVNRFVDLAGIMRKTPEPAKNALAVVSHFAFGGAFGALFGVANELWRRRQRRTSGAGGDHAPLAAGLAFGTAIWAISYAGWVPAFGAMPMPHDDRPGRQPSMVVAHWVYGAIVAKIIV